MLEVILDTRYFSCRLFTPKDIYVASSCRILLSFGVSVRGSVLVNFSK